MQFCTFEKYLDTSFAYTSFYANKRNFYSLNIVRVVLWYLSTIHVRIIVLEYLISFGVEYFITKIEVEVEAESLIENESNKS